MTARRIRMAEANEAAAELRRTDERNLLGVALTLSQMARWMPLQRWRDALSTGVYAVRMHARRAGADAADLEDDARALRAE